MIFEWLFIISGVLVVLISIITAMNSRDDAFIVFLGGVFIIGIGLWLKADNDKINRQAQECASKGGQYVQIFLSSDLCYGSNGKLLKAYQ